MNLRVIGCNYRNTPVEMRERLAFTGDLLTRALNDLASRYGCETILLSTCNRVEVYLAKPENGQPPEKEILAEFFSEYHHLGAMQILPHLYSHPDKDAIRHLFRVTASLDSLVIGEGQIAGQVKQAFEIAQQAGVTGASINVLFQHALKAAKRARSETGIAHGHVSVSSVAVDYVRQVFDHFGDKTILVIGAGKMGRVTLKHLRDLRPQRILVTNRSPEKAIEVARDCEGTAVPWEHLDDALTQADIVVSTTGASEPIVTRRRFDAIRAKRTRGRIIILDIAIPRDFDPRIHDGDQTCLFNIDDLRRICDQTLAQRHKHVPQAEAILEEEIKLFLDEWTRRQHAPVIAALTQMAESERKLVLDHLFSKLNGNLSDEDKAYIEGAFRRFQNKLLHPPIDAIRQASKEGTGHFLIDAIRKLFRL